MLFTFMRIFPIILLVALIFLPVPMQDEENLTDVHVLTALSASDYNAYVNETITLALYINVTVLYNNTPAEARNGTIDIYVEMTIPAGLSVLNVSAGEYANGTINASRDNSTEALLYVNLRADTIGKYTLSANINVTAAIYARRDNNTPSFFNDTKTVQSNMVHITVSEKTTETTTSETRTREDIYYSFKERIPQALLGLMILGFLLSNFIADRRAKRKRS